MFYEWFQFMAEQFLLQSYGRTYKKIWGVHYLTLNIIINLLLHGFWQLKVSFGAQSIEQANVLSEKINFSAPGGQKVAIFGMEDLDPQYFDVSNFSVPPDPPYMSKNANMCYF